MKPVGLNKIDTLIWDALSIDRARDFVVRNKSWLIFLLAVTLLSFTYELFNFTLTIDEDSHSKEGGNNTLAKLWAWASQDRWMMAFLNRYVLTEAVMPFTPLFIAIVFNAFGFVMMCLTFSDKKDRSLSDYIAAPFALALPTLYYLFQFSTVCYGAGIGVFLSASAVYCFVRCDGWKKISMIPLACMAIGIYQSFLTLIPCLFLLYVLNSILYGIEKITLKNIFVQTATFILFFIAAFFIHTLVADYTRTLVGIGKDAYLSGYFDYHLTFDYFITTLATVHQMMYKYYAGDPSIYIYDMSYLKYIVMISLAIVIYRIVFLPSSVLIKLTAIVSLYLLLFFPFAIYFLTAGRLPTRSLIALPLVISGLVYLGSSSQRLHVVRLVFISLTAVCFFKFSIINNRLSFSDDQVWKADRELATLILEKYNEVDFKIPADKRPTAIIIVGHHKWPQTPLYINSNSIGASFFDWGGGDSLRAADFFKTMGIYDFREATVDEWSPIVDQTLLMPVWPAQGSVDVINGMLVVRFGDYTWEQKNKICAGERSKSEACKKLG